MSMTKEQSLQMFRAQGAADALDLRKRAPQMDGTAIIAEEEKIPVWEEIKDYSVWVVGSPVKYEGQVYTLLIPHNAGHYPTSNPANTPSLWSIRHTKDSTKAKAWADPNGTSGMYMLDECYMEDDGQVYRCKEDNIVYRATVLPDKWEAVQV